MIPHLYTDFLNEHVSHYQIRERKLHRGRIIRRQRKAHNK